MGCAGVGLDFRFPVQVFVRIAFVTPQADDEVSDTTFTQRGVQRRTYRACGSNVRCRSNQFVSIISEYSTLAT